MTLSATEPVPLSRGEIQALFPPSYAASRSRFQEGLAQVQQRWPAARLQTHPLAESPELGIDWIQAEALSENRKLLLFTMAEHGVEGFLGSAMLQRFMQVYLPRLDPQTTAIRLVHTINPWGMQHRRRTNANNVDLNRNFVLHAEDLDPSFNPAYPPLDVFFAPERPARGGPLEYLGFSLRLLRSLARLGAPAFWEAARLGQYSHPGSLHYGGERVQQETGVLMGIFREALERAEQVLHLDMHTGHGPRYQMSLVNSGLEPRSSAQLSRQFGYPLVVAAVPGEFYAMRGDMIDYFYALRDRDFPEKRLYATSFEFGTFGTGPLARLRGLRAMIRENQMHWHGCSRPGVQARVAKEFMEMFGPASPRWRAKALADADQAFQGILRSEGFIP